MTATPWRADILTLYPEAFPGTLGVGVIGKGKQQNLWQLNVHNIRNFATDKHLSVDDTPAGGGPGMVMRADILAKAIDAIFDDQKPLLMMSPRGKPLTQKRVRALASGAGVNLICPRFEGYDERIITKRSVETVSLGDMIYAGGDIAAMALIEACVRLIPGVLGDARSTEDESFETPLLEHAHYTRPIMFEGEAIPEVLRSGHHGAIEAWRQQEREAATQKYRPDLWQAFIKEET